MLRLRKVEENLAMARLAQIVRQTNQQEQQIDQARSAMQSELDQFSQNTNQHFEIDAYTRYMNYIDRLESNVRQAEIRLTELQPELQAEQQKTMEARRKKRIVEKQKESAWQKYKEEYQKQERKMIAELNLQSASSVGQSLIKEIESEPYQNYPGMERQLASSEPVDPLENEESIPESNPDPLQQYLDQIGYDPFGKK
ncbi:MAG: flagellar FliJ family protein [Leptospiraceae bacterium]|nr:flagellar FliJ family protein [Leptospiraceae bacterium]